MSNINLFGHDLRALRKRKGIKLRTLAAYLDIDPGILSKIENGHRRAKREQVIDLAAFFEIDAEALLVPWLAEQVVELVRYDEWGSKALQVAESQVAYTVASHAESPLLDRKIHSVLQKYPQVQRAWLFGSRMKGNYTPESDLDLMIESGDGFSYFDLAALQLGLEEITHFKVDIGFWDTLKPEIKAKVKKQSRLIYEKK